jgi:hypothetical protein
MQMTTLLASNTSHLVKLDYESKLKPNEIYV